MLRFVKPLGLFLAKQKDSTFWVWSFQRLENDQFLDLIIRYFQISRVGSPNKFEYSNFRKYAKTEIRSEISIFHFECAGKVRKSWILNSLDIREIPMFWVRKFGILKMSKNVQIFGFEKLQRRSTNQLEREWLLVTFRNFLTNYKRAKRKEIDHSRTSDQSTTTESWLTDESFNRPLPPKNTSRLIPSISA